jgi:3-methyladenine DNA glycosylase AlkD
MKSKLLKVLRTRLRAVADPKRAVAQRAYMKSVMPYHGVSASLVDKVCREVFRDLHFASAKEWQTEVLGIWRGARFREERYCAIRLSAHRSGRAFQTPAALKMYEEMIVTGAWWDFVDELAAHHVGTILRNYPKSTRAKMLSWSQCGNLWKRRTSIICQLTFKEETDLNLLYSCIEPSIDSKEFFLRKAIGWALRQYAWTDPREIRRYVKLHQDRLSGLSRREALKNI